MLIEGSFSEGFTQNHRVKNTLDNICYDLKWIQELDNDNKILYHNKILNNLDLKLIESFIRKKKLDNLDK